MNQGGKRKGAVCAYLETWHLDIEEFELRKNTGDERRRTHDMNTANWVPDLFMKRVFNDEDWTLFSLLIARICTICTAAPLKSATTKATVADAIPPRQSSRHLAQDAKHAVRNGPPLGHLQRQLQPALAPSTSVIAVRTGTEITLNTSIDEIAVCNLGSVNLKAHVHVTAAWIMPS